MKICLLKLLKNLKIKLFRQKWKLKKMRNRPDIEDLFIENVNLFLEYDNLKEKDKKNFP